MFLSVRGPKLLLLAGTDRLDKDLLVGQMQGKFQLVVLPAVGHVVQEDVRRFFLSLSLSLSSFSATAQLFSGCS